MNLQNKREGDKTISLYSYYYCTERMLPVFPIKIFEMIYKSVQNEIYIYNI